MGAPPQCLGNFLATNAQPGCQIVGMHQCHPMAQSLLGGWLSVCRYPASIATQDSLVENWYQIANVEECLLDGCTPERCSFAVESDGQLQPLNQQEAVWTVEQ